MSETRKRQNRRRQSSQEIEPIDLREALESPVRRKLPDGGTAPLDPYEALLRQHVKSALVDLSIPSMKLALSEAEKHKLIMEPPPPATGGVFTVPKNLPVELDKQIFDHPDHAGESRRSLSDIWYLLLTVIDMKQLKRCFSERR